MTATTEVQPPVKETANPILALLKNRQLTNAATWKQLGMLVTTLMGISPLLGFLFPQFKSLLSPEFLGSVLGAVTALSQYFSVATTGKIGISA